MAGPSQPRFPAFALDYVLGIKLFYVRLMPIFDDCCVGEVTLASFLLLIITLSFYWLVAVCIILTG